MTRDIISIEKVLNSRCSSDFTIGPEKRHWGTFINRRPQNKVINRIIRFCKVPRFSSGKLLHWFKDRYFFVGFENQKEPHLEQILHIESGMQHEAVHLACAAQGIGACIRNEGVDGTEYDERIATAKHLMMEMADPYESGKYTTEAPGPEKPFRRGRNLDEPERDGDVECMLLLDDLSSFNRSGSSSTMRDISQLLWAAKGRTPHRVRMNVWDTLWGLTIPTWGGGQDYTSVFLVKDDKLYRYVNWTRSFSGLNRLFQNYTGWTWGNPTHDLQFVKDIKIRSQLDDADTAIILCRNEETGRALWEVGYMLENMLLQASGLYIYYESKIFKTEKISQLAKLGLKNAVAVMLL